MLYVQSKITFHHLQRRGAGALPQSEGSPVRQSHGFGGRDLLGVAIGNEHRFSRVHELANFPEEERCRV